MLPWHDGFWRDMRRKGIGLGVLGVVLSTSISSADQGSAGTFHAACAAGGQVDAATAATLCAEFFATVKDRHGAAAQTGQPLPLAVGPGLEVIVDRASETGFQVIPTWLDADGKRTTHPPMGVSVVDAKVNETLRRLFFERLLENFPE